MTDPTEQASWAADLERFERLMGQLQARPGVGSLGLGVAEWDSQLWRMGRQWLASHAIDIDAAGETRVTDVYLATRVYNVGGHTALIGDFVRALRRPSHLVLTDLGTEHSPLSDEIRARLNLTESQITMLAGPTSFDRLQQAFAVLRQLGPARLFLFHHPHDPLASVIAQPEIASHCLLVHHADATPSFAMHVPGVRIIDLTESAAAMTRVLGSSSSYLPLTCPDPGPRPCGFLERQMLVTASSGSPHKFATPYPLGYAETVGVILRATSGWHVHIGPLSDTARDDIAHALQRARIDADRFIYVPWAASLATTFWQQHCDAYVASFPIDGARTKVEAMAAGLPYLGHSRVPICAESTAAVADGALRWHTWDDLSALLQRLSNPATLEHYSAIVRGTYETTHQPLVFAERLMRIADGTAPLHEPHPDFERRATSLLMRSLITASRAELA